MMNGINPWVSDLRNSGYRPVSRTGLPPLRSQYHIRGFKLGRVFATLVLALALTSLLYCGRTVTSYSVMPPIERDYHPGENSLHSYNHLLIISDHYEVQEFFGETFSNNPDVFYSTRPFAPVFSSCGNDLNQFKANLLEDYFNCRLKNQSYLYEIVGFNEHMSSVTDDVNESCFENNYCFRNHNRKICDLCEYEGSGCEGCGATDISLASRVCSHTKVRAATVELGACGALCLDQLLSRNNNIKIVVIGCADCSSNVSNCRTKNSNYLKSFNHLSFTLKSFNEDRVLAFSKILEYSEHQTKNVLQASKINPKFRRKRDAVN